MTEGLSAGGYLRGSENWEAYHDGERLLLQDRKLNEERQGAVVIADELSSTLLMAATLNDLPNVVVIADRLADGVDLGKVRAERLRHVSLARRGDSYWAVYVVENNTVVSLGTPYSSSRLVADILRAELGHAFEQRRVCGECGQLNPYRSQFCTSCGTKLQATGRLNRWIHYDNEETVHHELTPDEKEQVKEANTSKSKAKDTFVTPLLSWREMTLKRKAARKNHELEEALSSPTLPLKKPHLLPDTLVKRPKKPPAKAAGPDDTTLISRKAES
jgi:hypothetical protein